MARYTLEQRVFLYDTYVKYGSTRKCRQKFQHKFHDERVPSRQTVRTELLGLWTWPIVRYSGN
jgi:hypothetical protein